MHFTIVGWNFKNTPIEIRDKLALSRKQQIEIGNQLKLKFKLGGVAVLSTCNRTEFYFVNAEQKVEKIILELKKYFSIQELAETVYIKIDLDGVRHLYRVASSMESMVLGEPQILGQLKDSFQNFSEAGLTGKILHHLFTRAFYTAKRVRTETTI